MMNVHPLHGPVTAARAREVITREYLLPELVWYGSFALPALPLVDVVDPGPELNSGVAQVCAFDA